jgi:hypothetical protein
MTIYAARCTACSHKGATIQHPGWAGAHWIQSHSSIVEAPLTHGPLLGKRRQAKTITAKEGAVMVAAAVLVTVASLLL